MEDKLSRAQGKRLLLLARAVIGARLGLVDEINEDGLEDRALEQKRGTFVTIKIDGQLRGCIGNLEPDGTVLESVRRNSISSAFNDYRFSPLSVDEFSRISLDISILSEPRRLDYIDGDDLIRLLTPGVDGVILSRGSARATFLPQVWMQLPEPDQFLDHLCLKAGLARSAWRDGHPDIFVYKVQHFEEDACEAGDQ